MILRIIDQEHVIRILVVPVGKKFLLFYNFNFHLPPLKESNVDLSIFRQISDINELLRMDLL